MVLSLITQGESLMSPASEATQTGKIFLILVWIKDLFQMAWVTALLEIVLDKVLEEMAMEGVDY